MVKSPAVRVPAIAIACGLLGSCINVIVHNEKSASQSATQFARTAFVSHDDAKAHALLAPSVAQQIPRDKLAETIAAMHPKAFPSRVVATDYEPMPGQRGMVIYLKGDADGEDFYYRLVMAGDASIGYRVSGFFRGSGPYPSTAKRPLK